MIDVSPIALTDKDLLYAATGRCRCGGGLAHPIDHQLAMTLRSWVCSRVLKGDACGLGHHWFPGPCPGCGYAVGGAGTHRSDEGRPIETRYSNVVTDAPDAAIGEVA
jgi:hypothetical protein